MNNNSQHDSGKYVVEINGEIYEVSFSGELGKVTVNDKTLALDMQPKSVPDHFSMLLGGKSVVLAVESTEDASKYRVHAGGYDFDVDVASSREAYLREFLRAAGVGVKQGRVVAPMPGLIIKLEVEIGQTVELGQGILIMEAMKMENEIKAPVKGVLKSIHVNTGEAVEKGKLLFEIE